MGTRSYGLHLMYVDSNGMTQGTSKTFVDGDFIAVNSFLSGKANSKTKYRDGSRTYFIKEILNGYATHPGTTTYLLNRKSHGFAIIKNKKYITFVGKNI